MSVFGSIENGKPSHKLMLSAIATALVLAPRTWTLAVGGDIMLYAMDPNRPAFDAVAPYFRAATVSYANLEIPLTKASTATTRKTAEEIKAKTQFVLKADPRHITQLSRSGISIFGLANNHTMDFGPRGMRETIALLNKAKLPHQGAGENLEEANRVRVIQLENGIRVGVLTYLAYVGSRAAWKCTPAGPKSPGIATIEFNGVLNEKAKQTLRTRIAEARKSCDFVLVAPHWGIERESKPRPWQITLGRALVDAGADAVVGAHPHVLQGKEVYKGKPILYSLGNLISPLPAQSAVYTLRFEETKFRGISFRPIRNRNGKVEWLPAKAEAARIKEIAALDRLIPKPKTSK